MSRQFDSAEEQAEFIADRIESYVGHPFQDSPDEPLRGLAYSDMAILLRSVRKDAGPLMDALRDREIPFIVRGVQQLFEQPEVEAARCIFLYIAGELEHPTPQRYLDGSRCWRHRKERREGHPGASRHV